MEIKNKLFSQKEEINNYYLFRKQMIEMYAITVPEFNRICGCKPRKNLKELKKKIHRHGSWRQNPD